MTLKDRNYLSSESGTPYGTIDPGVLQYQDTQLTDAQIRALAATNVTVVDAPGAGLAVVVEAIFAYLTVATAYDDAAVDGNLNLKYSGGADGSAGIDDFEADAFIDAASSTARYLSATDPLAEVTPVANTAVVLDNDGAEFTGGAAGNSLSVRVWFRVVPMAAFV